MIEFTERRFRQSIATLRKHGEGYRRGGSSCKTKVSSPMVAAISGPMARPGSAIHGSKGRFFFQVPDLRDEQCAAISREAAWPAFIGICRALHDAGRRGRTVAIRQDAENGKVGVGLRAIARAMKVDPKTVRRQVGRLERLGMAVVVRPTIVHIHDPKTGQIVTKHKGRTPPALVYLTIVDAHMRPSRKGAQCLHSQEPAGASMGGKVPPPRAFSKGQSAPPSKEPKTKEAETAGSLSRPSVPADEAGRHAAAGAGQEEVIVTTITPDEPGAVVTVESTLGRPAAPAGNSRPQEAAGGAPDSTASVTTPPDDSDNPADGSGLNPAAGSWLEEFERLTGKKEARQRARAEAEKALRERLDALPPSKRKRAKRLSKKARESAAAEQMLKDIVRQRQASQSKEQAAATKAHYRDQYRAEKAMAVA